MARQFLNFTAEASIWRGLKHITVKQLMKTGQVDDPDAAFGNMLIEQFGGANGELANAMQYSGQASTVMKLIAATC